LSDAERKLMNKDSKVHCGCTDRAVVINAFGMCSRKRFHRKGCQYFRVLNQ
jgi:hypothetical protein